MKYLCVILDGAADRPMPELGDRTPLIAGTGTHLKALAQKARVGAVQTLPPDWTGDPEAALVSLFGYPPATNFTGRGPLDAAALEIPMDPHDIAFRCHFVHLGDNRLQDPCAGRLSRQEGRELLQHVQETLRIRALQFYPAAAHRHVLVWREGPASIQCSSPHDVAGEELRAGLPRGDRAERLIGVMWDTAEVLRDHPINRRRRDEGKPTADMLWPWSPGPCPRLQGFGFRHGTGGACIAGNPMVQGLARLTGLRLIDVPGATGTLDTDYVQKARATLTALGEFSFCLVHIEAPNEAGLRGDYEAKVDAVRRIDERYFGTVLDRIGLLDDFRILVVVDHETCCRPPRFQPGWLPFMIAGNLERRQVRNILPFDERAAEDAEWRIDEGWRLLDLLFEDAP